MTSSAPESAPDGPAARQWDAADPLRRWRDEFLIPTRPDGTPVIYFAGNSLGLQPKSVRASVEQELDDWARLGVEGHFHARNPWFPYHENFRDAGARLVGAGPHEVVYMNGLTVNLHLMMVSFYRPSATRYRILIEDAAFPSDNYAVRTQLAWRGLDAETGLLVARPRPGEHALRTEDLLELLERQGPSIALVLLPGVHYYTGQALDLPAITAAARRQGCIVGLDLAHAAGNLPLHLHDWGVDFACWCTYKYLNCGPGAVAGCFIHERHAQDTTLPRFGGWWGNDPATRFRMHLEPDFKPVASADAWQLSNPPILTMAAMRASLAIFDQVGMPALRERSLRLTGYLLDLLEPLGRSGRIEVITPRPPEARGCQVSLLVHDRPRELLGKLSASGVVCDYREPNVIRVAPTPLYNTFHEAWRFAEILRGHVDAAPAGGGGRPHA